MFKEPLFIVSLKNKGLSRRRASCTNLVIVLLAICVMKFGIIKAGMTLFATDIDFENLNSKRFFRFSV